ncbi:MAG: site-specific integrase [Oscillospiraceae bacterium]|nr:site-specific integrase [Oscillospiraceae bacterium]
MAVYKEKNTNTWRVIYRQTDWTRKTKQSSKRGFTTKREALAWEREQLLKTQADLDMSFSAFVDLYTRDMKPRLRLSTWETKEHMIASKLLPYFGEKCISKINASDIIQWQNEMMSLRKKDGQAYSATYLKSLHNQINAILNHAVRFYGLASNPATKVGSMGKKEAQEMNFWTKEQFLKFSNAIKSKPLSYHAFELLYWTGIRSGELLALTPSDFCFDKGTVNINKTYQRLYRQDIVTEPKTPKSHRTVAMPDFISREIKEYLNSLYGYDSHERIFPFTKSYLHHEMTRGAKQAGVKRIRVHDLRHSHVSLLIEMGFSAVAIADRVGHESIDITYRYAHLFPATQAEMAVRLNVEREAS